MQIYPAIDLKDGQCVRLKQGDFDRVTVFHSNPADVAREFVQNGADYIHVVDLDGARLGSGVNEQAIHAILQAVSVPVQVGGGIRSMDDVKRKLEMGVRRVILGTAAVRTPEFVKEAIATYGDRIAVGIDAKDGLVAISAWEQVSETTALALCLDVEKMGGRTVIYTDIAKDGMMSGPNLEMTKRLIDSTGLEIIASGGVSGMDDLERVKDIRASGVIVGKALYEGKVLLHDAIARFQSAE